MLCFSKYAVPAEATHDAAVVAASFVQSSFDVIRQAFSAKTDA
jgi:hypothetical protein